MILLDVQNTFLSTCTSCDDDHTLHHKNHLVFTTEHITTHLDSLVRLRPGRSTSRRGEPRVTVCVVHGSAEMDRTSRARLDRVCGRPSIGWEGVAELGLCGASSVSKLSLALECT